MATVITAGNATNGLSFNADNTGALDIKTGTGAGTTAISISSSQVATFTAAPIGAGMLTSGTAVTSTSGTSIDFTSIPSWVKRVTVMFQGVSTNGTSNIQIQLGDSGGVEVTGYLSAGRGSVVANSTTGLLVTGENAASQLRSGVTVICSLGSNTWASSGTLSGNSGGFFDSGAGSKTLSDVLTQIRITTVNGTDTFDAGTINILYE